MKNQQFEARMLLHKLYKPKEMPKSLRLIKRNIRTLKDTSSLSEYQKQRLQNINKCKLEIEDETKELLVLGKMPSDLNSFWKENTFKKGTKTSVPLKELIQFLIPKIDESFKKRGFALEYFYDHSFKYEIREILRNKLANTSHIKDPTERKIEDDKYNKDFTSAWAKNIYLKQDSVEMPLLKEIQDQIQNIIAAHTNGNDNEFEKRFYLCLITALPNIMGEALSLGVDDVICKFESLNDKYFYEEYLKDSITDEVIDVEECLKKSRKKLSGTLKQKS
ncbi:hypothetical protein [Halobacteriovorax sp. DA5]|uniref:hypothetical protein n=1 Tax=Halobacteriovorax sp. DA5 TaxID=2067553 RepID=UPI000CD0853A|nr:hypothetical protein [Halobacteriovorax sp. DA5]POB13870.1 hypothetical protein C0Z22_07360 [Halobacteriovorax sp. DA5]